MQQGPDSRMPVLLAMPGVSLDSLGIWQMMSCTMKSPALRFNKEAYSLKVRLYLTRKWEEGKTNCPWRKDKSQLIALIPTSIVW